MGEQVKHTPGPWEVRETGKSGKAWEKDWREIFAGRTPIVSHREYESNTYGTIGGVYISEANARLIAAAPELLAACEAGLDLYEIGREEAMAKWECRDETAKRMNQEAAEIKEAISAAIAKAKASKAENESRPAE
jgi:hypothetical protein